MPRSKFRLRQRLLYVLERQFVKGPHYQLLFVAALIGLLSVAGGLLVWPGGDVDETAGEAIWWAFLRLSDPGYLGDDEGLWRRLISTLLTVAGYVVFLGSLVAIITAWLNSKIRRLEQGFTQVAAKNHVVILGRTNRTVHIVAELLLSIGRVKGFLRRQGAQRLNVMVLAEEVSHAQVREFSEHPGIGSRAGEVVFRSGQSIDRLHLRRVDVVNAAAVIIPAQNTSVDGLLTSDVHTVKTLLSLNAETSGRARMPFAVAEVLNENMLKAAARAYSGPLEVVAADTIISRLVAQNIRHPGLSLVYNELLSRRVSNNIYAAEMPEAVGKTYAQISRMLPRAVVVGAVSTVEDGFRTALNPAPDQVFRLGDRLVLVARDSSDIVPLKRPSKLPPQTAVGSTKPETTFRSRKIRLLILGWNQHIPALIRELNTYRDEHYDVTVLSLRDIGFREKTLAPYLAEGGPVSCRHILADHLDEHDLRRANPASFDHILLAGSDRLSDSEEADARTLVGYMLLEDVLENASERPQILTELSDPNNESLLRRFDCERITGPLILSHLLAQIALRRELHAIFTELFTVGGAEIIFRLPSDFGAADDAEYTFAAIEELTASAGDRALGLYLPPGAGRTSPSVALNPSRERKFTMGPGVRVVVLTTVYRN